ncbi:glycoside hydrolase family 78 protein [Aeoliella sp. ICT_H6.2]|uniref:alpha-L-rhamnosidase n=1 Tax=Aeoliella straminimaris TaxID=2954799 RepID=A0A9X2FI12_9BACT|nr:family 78 glycoside hydrolase catalytic domain [Aeoliella straminimaris]MCO6045466.1 glycoside hydrolase family 78 protein [Aeoliella straminimaris]
MNIVYRLSVTLVLSVCLNLVAHAESPHSLTVSEGFENPLGFYDPAPTFSWKLPAGVEKQTAYQLEVNSDGNTWDSGWVESDQSTLVPSEAGPFESRDKVEWRVRFRDAAGNESEWSDRATFEMGLLSKSDWQAKWIRPAQDKPDVNEPVAYLQRTFDLPAGVKQARLYVTARGLFDLDLNGQQVSNDHFANGWTSYNKRIDTLTYDVTDQLKAGENTIQASLGYGWYAGHLMGSGHNGRYGKLSELLLQLEVTLEDGTTTTITSDDQWQGTWQGPIISSSIYDGENYDARIEISGWQQVATAELGDEQLDAKPFTPVRQTQLLSTEAITEPEPGRFVFDLGQNMVGWERLEIPVEEGKTVTIRFAEMLNQDGTMYTENYRGAKSTDTYTAAETGTIEWEPQFTFHGFRYVELSGLPEGVKPAESWVTGVVLHSDLEPIGTFVSSHDKLNQLQSNITWGQRGNFLDIPTDCPQRDERMGWTGDAQVFCPTSMFNYDCHAFWKSWMRSLRDDQMADGRIPHVLPDALRDGGSPGWMDAATIIPWEVYVRTGDKEILTENIDMMEKLIGYYRSKSKDGLVQEITAFGDWLQPYSPRTQGDTPAPLLGTAYYGHSARLLAKSARVVGRDDLADKYDAEADKVAQAFAAHYFDGNGKLQNAPETQTAYLLAIAFDLIPDEQKPEAAANVVRLIEEADGHLRTGFLGTPYIVSVLDEQGYHDLAYSLLLKETYPSWFYSINQGATTMWERWNSYSHTDGFGNAGMNSFNHYAYGAIGQWMYERIAGLAPDPKQPGYKHLIIRPLIDGPLDSAKAELETPYGIASSGWTKSDGTATLTVVIPPNTTATLTLPGSDDSQELQPGKHEFEVKLEEGA